MSLYDLHKYVHHNPEARALALSGKRIASAGQQGEPEAVGQVEGHVPDHLAPYVGAPGNERMMMLSPEATEKLPWVRRPAHSHTQHQPASTSMPTMEGVGALSCGQAAWMCASMGARRPCNVPPPAFTCPATLHTHAHAHAHRRAWVRACCGGGAPRAGSRGWTGCGTLSLGCSSTRRGRTR